MILTGEKDEELGEMCSGADLFTRNLILTALGSNAALFGGRLAVSPQFCCNPHVLTT